MRSFVVVVVVALGGSSAAASPPAPSASAVLANVQQRYASVGQLTAQFHEVVTTASFATRQVSDGKLWASKPSKVRFDYVGKRRGTLQVFKSFIFDGATMWLVDHDSLQIYKHAVQGGSLPASLAFLTNAGALAKDFNVSRSALTGKSGIVLELVPKQPSAQYKQIFLVVDSSSWGVTESIVVNGNGATTDITFVQTSTKAQAPPSTFVFDPRSLPTYKLIVP